MIYLIFFIFGLFFGSFGSVLLTRFDNIKNKKDFLKKFKSSLRGRSKCPNCNHILNVNNLFPVLSFIVQKGKCSYCKKNIDNFYIILEILSGLFFVLFAFLSTKLFGLNIEYLIYNLQFRLFFFINWFLFLLLIWDQKTLFLHFSIRIITFILSIIFSILYLPFFLVLKTFIIIGSLFVILYFLGKLRVKYRLGVNGEGIGEGDIWLSIIISLLFPLFFQIYGIVFSYFNIFYYFVLRITISSLLGIILYFVNDIFLLNFLNIKKKELTKNKVVPFFLALILGFWILLFFGKYLLY